MALAYLDLAKTLTAPDNDSDQTRLLVEQAIIRLVSGRTDPLQEAKLIPPTAKSWTFILGFYADLSTGRLEDSLGRCEALLPQCCTDSGTDEQYEYCPLELVRLFRDLGNHTAAKALGDVLIRDAELWASRFPKDLFRWDYASKLAVSGRADEALNVLEELVASGWRGSFVFQTLPFTFYVSVAWDAVRDDERFQAIVATIEADMAQQLENVREMQRRGDVPTLEEVQAMIASHERESGSDGE